MNYSFHHIHLLCSDLESTISFFTNNFGAQLMGRPEFGGKPGASLKIDGTTINLKVAGDAETVDADANLPIYGYHHICFEVDDVDAAYKELMDKGLEFTLTPRDIPGNLRVAFCKGPDGIAIEILQAL